MVIEFVLVHAHQTDQRIAGEDVEINIRQWFQLIDLAHRRNHGEKQTELGDFAGFFHDVHAI